MAEMVYCPNCHEFYQGEGSPESGYICLNCGQVFTIQAGKFYRPGPTYNDLLKQAFWVDRTDGALEPHLVIIGDMNYPRRDNIRLARSHWENLLRLQRHKDNV